MPLTLSSKHWKGLNALSGQQCVRYPSSSLPEWIIFKCGFSKNDLNIHAWEAIKKFVIINTFNPHSFFAITQKIFELGKLIFLAFLINSFRSLMAKSWAAFIPTALVLRHTANMPNFNYTRLNLYLDLLPVIGFQRFTALWKAYYKSRHIAQSLQWNFAHIFLQMPLKGIFLIFSCIHIYVLKILQMFLHIWIRWVKGFSKMYQMF